MTAVALRLWLAQGSCTASLYLAGWSSAVVTVQHKVWSRVEAWVALLLHVCGIVGGTVVVQCRMWAATLC
jgi:hypothetical protein